MATAQILIYIVRPTEVPVDTIRAAVTAAAQAQGLTPSAWTYASTAVSISPDGTVTGGPLDGVTFPFTSLSSHRLIVSAFRQNVAGLPEGGDALATALNALRDAIRPALVPSSTPNVAMKIATRTTRIQVSWDKGVPAPLALPGEAGAGGGLGWGVLALIGVGAVYIAAQGKTGLMGLPERKQGAVEIDRAKAVLRQNPVGRGYYPEKRESLHAAQVLMKHGYSWQQIKRIGRAA